MIVSGLLLASACGGARGPAARRWVVVTPHEDPTALPARQITPPPDRQPSPRARAEAALAEARAHAVRFQPAEALAAASRAQEVLESHIETDEARLLLHRALALRALFESNLEDADASQRSLERAARLDPTATLDPALFPPDLIERYTALARAVRAEPPASVSITTDPPGAQLRLDGRDLGMSPASTHTRSGAHFVAASALGYASRVLGIRVETEATPPLALSLPAASPAQLAAQLLSLDETALASLSVPARSMLADRLDADVLIRIDEGRLVALSLSDSRSVTEARNATDVQGLVARLFHDPADDVLGSPWLWVAVGLVVAGVTATTLSAVLYEPPQVLRIGTP